MIRHLFIRGSLGLALSITTLAQHPGMPGSPPPGNGRPGSLPDEATLEQPQQQLVMGKVTLEDGTAPPDPVAIQLICTGVPRLIAYTDLKGRFSADLGNRLSRPVFADASEPAAGPANTRIPNGLDPSSPIGAPGSTLRQQDLMSCELRAYLPGFRSDVVQLAGRRLMDKPDVGVMVLRRLSKVEGQTISATSALAPSDAKKAFEKAHKDELKEKWADAQKEYEKAVTIYPKYAAAWYELGNLQQDRNDLDGARRSYAKAVEADPKFVSPYGQLASIAAGEKKWQEVIDNTSHLLQLDPVDFPQAWLYNALAHFGLEQWDAAAKSAREGLSHDPDHHFPKLNQVLGSALALERDYPGAAQNLRDYLRYSPNASDADEVSKQLAQIEKVLEPQPDKR